MATGLIHLHSTLRWVLLLLLVFALVNSWRGWMGKKEFTNGNRKVLLFTLISTHIQLVLGFALFFMNGWHKIWGQSDWMSVRGLRFWALEHPIQMTVAIALVTIGYSRAKRRDGAWTAHRTAAVFMTVGLLFILAAIPWSFYGPEVARPLFPGM